MSDTTGPTIIVGYNPRHNLWFVWINGECDQCYTFKYFAMRRAKKMRKKLSGSTTQRIGITNEATYTL